MAFPGVSGGPANNVATPAVTYTTWNSADKHAEFTLSGGDLVATLTGGGGGYRVVHGVAAKSTGKFYFEVVMTGSLDANVAIGLARVGSALNQALGDGTFNAGSGGLGGAGSYTGYGAGAGAPDPAVGDVVSLAINLTDDLIWYRVNGGDWNASATADPATNTEGKDCAAATSAGSCLPAYSCFSNGSVCTANFGSTAFTYTVPSGYTAGWTA